MADVDVARRSGSAKPVKSKRQQDPFSRTAGFLKCAVTQHDDLHEWDKDVLLDTIYWLRQTVMLLVGVLYGLLPFTGLYAFITAIVINASCIILWCKWQSVDEEEQGGWKDLLTEGMAPSVSVFLLAWIITYSLTQY
eukprot:jgi/Astpho2/718/Aster-x0954